MLLTVTKNCDNISIIVKLIEVKAKFKLQHHTIFHTWRALVAVKMFQHFAI